jgi:LmbE family N-acetylglucosaminyl deacetylase
MTGSIVEYVERSGIREVVIVSPHLDDAAFSTSGLLLSKVSHRCRVLTVFTQANAQSDPGWAQAGGFADPVQEHAARRQEDHDAMTRAGVRFAHLGFGPGEFTSKHAAQLARRIASQDGEATDPSSSERILCLLPAGAGLSGRRGNSTYRWRRLTGKHPGASAHPEHLAVRDGLLQHLIGHRCRVGFYNEFPYLWRDWTWRVQRQLRTLSARPVKRFTTPADRESKLRLMDVYASQVALAFGPNRQALIRAIDRDEEYFVVRPEQ